MQIANIHSVFEKVCQLNIILQNFNVNVLSISEAWPLSFCSETDLEICCIFVKTSKVIVIATYRLLVGDESFLH